MCDILIIGNVSIDNIITPTGKLYIGQIGGNAFHSVASAALWRNRTLVKKNLDSVKILCAVPSNFSENFFLLLEKYGIDTKGIIRINKKVEKYECFIYESDGERIDRIFISDTELFINFLQKSLPKDTGTVFQLSSTDINNLKKKVSCDSSEMQGFALFRKTHAAKVADIPQLWNKIKGIHLAPMEFDSHVQFVDWAHKNHMFITLDPGIYLKEEQKEKIYTLLNRVAVFLPSKKEVHFLFPDLTLNEALLKLQKEVACSVVIKNGREGCLVWDAITKRVYKVSVTSAIPFDWTGAGDSFCGTLISRMAIGDSLLDAVRWATVVSGFAIQKTGVLNRLEYYQSLSDAELLQAYNSLFFEEITI